MRLAARVLTLAFLPAASVAAQGTTEYPAAQQGSPADGPARTALAAEEADRRPASRIPVVDCPAPASGGANRTPGRQLTPPLDVGHRRGPTAGIRSDVDSLAAFTLPASHVPQTTRATLKRVDAQVSFML